jgi:hypothetical protein
MKSDLSKVKAGDKIWTIKDGWVEVIRVDEDDYPIFAGEEFYRVDGKLDEYYQYPSAFTEYPFKEQPIEKDTIVWYRDQNDSYWVNGYYSHFENGKHWCFVGSKKSTETKDCLEWKIVTTENPLT